MAKDWEDRGATLGVLIAQAAARLEVANMPGPHRIAVIVGKMRSYARQAKRAAEAACNYNASERTENMRRARLERHQAEVNAWLAEYGLAPELRVSLGGDPRGCCGKLHIEGERGDGWGDGFAIY